MPCKEEGEGLQIPTTIYCTSPSLVPVKPSPTMAQANISQKCEKPQGEAKAGKYTGLKPPEDEPYDSF